ncbi:MAG: (2Fe-2S)-binding protein [Planctomycetota bacterium]|nr:(2Fe-2S)-binding protein [Planctomycetota bacterium]
MIVCHCTGKTDTQIRRAVEAGARSCSDVTRACDAGGVCGGCTPLIEMLTKGEHALTHRRPPAASR